MLKDGDYSTKNIINVKNREDRKIARKYWMITYYDDDFNSRNNIENIIYKLGEIDIIMNYVFQIEKVNEGNHSHIAIELLDCGDKPVPRFDTAFPGGKIQSVKDIKIAREYCSKKYSRHPKFEPIFYGLEVGEKERLILEGVEEKNINLLRETVERKKYINAKKINLRSDRKLNKFKIEEIKKSEDNYNKASKDKEKEINGLRGTITDNESMIEDHKRMVKKKKATIRNYLKRKSMIQRKVIKLDKNTENIAQKELLDKKKEFTNEIEKIEDNILKKQEEIEECKKYISDTREHTTFTEKRINETININLDDYIKLNEDADFEEESKKNLLVVKESLLKINIDTKLDEYSKEESKNSKKKLSVVKETLLEINKKKRNALKNSKSPSILDTYIEEIAKDNRKELTIDTYEKEITREIIKDNEKQDDIARLREKIESQDKMIKESEKEKIGLEYELKSYEEAYKESETKIEEYKAEVSELNKEHNNTILKLNDKHDSMVKVLTERLNRHRVKSSKTEFAWEEE